MIRKTATIRLSREKTIPTPNKVEMTPIANRAEIVRSG